MHLTVKSNELALDSNDHVIYLREKKRDRERQRQMERERERESGKAMQTIPRTKIYPINKILA